MSPDMSPDNPYLTPNPQDSAEIFVRMSAENIAAEELRQLRLGLRGKDGG